jgi:acid phosphatase
MSVVARGRAAVVLAAVVLLAACTSPSSSGPPSAGTGPARSSSVAGARIPAPEHVLLVVFENKDAGAVIGSPQAPYLTSLARSGANFTDAHGVTHPSQPNYLALFSGSTQGVTDDHCPQALSGPNLAAQLTKAGKTFVGYSEGLPKAGATDCQAGDYRRKHNPWVDFGDLPAQVNQPYSSFPDDFADLPTVSFVVPDMCHDMHDCDVATGDRWARENLDPYVTWAKTHDSLLIVTFDESEGGDSSNHITTFFVGPMVHVGDDTTRIDHYTVLRTIEEMYGLSAIGTAAAREPIAGIWTAG